MHLLLETSVHLLLLLTMLLLLVAALHLPMNIWILSRVRWGWDRVHVQRGRIRITLADVARRLLILIP